MVQQSKYEYAWIKRLADNQVGTLDTSTVDGQDGINGLILKFKKLGGS